MLNIDLVRNDPDIVRKAIADKGIPVDLDLIVELDGNVRAKRHELDNLRARRRQIASNFTELSAEDQVRQRQLASELSSQIRGLEAALEGMKRELDDQLLRLPNIPWAGAPVGPDENSNVVIRQVGTPPKFDFQPKDHVDLIEFNNWGEPSRVSKISGARTYCLKGRLAQVEQALLFHVSNKMAAIGFHLVSTPALAREKAFINTGHFPSGRDDVFALPRDDLFLAGTSEIILTSLHGDEILAEHSLPVLYAGYSPCFRREAGSAGKDVRGLLRVHQFYKVEQYVICKNDPDQSAEWHERLLQNAEEILKELSLAYRVVECSTGDMGLGKFRMNDIETWVPSLDKYRETHSCSSLHEWQARRANIRYRDAAGRVNFCHTLNNTAIATPRILAPLIEAYQTESGRVRMPTILKPYLSGEYI